MSDWNLELFTGALYDFERAQYLILSNLQCVRRDFSNNRIYPHLGDLITLYGTLQTIVHGSESLREALPGARKIKALTAMGRAGAYVRAANPADITAITFDPSNGEPWSALETEIPLTELDARGSITEAVRRYLRDRRRVLSDDDFLTLVVPEVLRSARLSEVFRRPAKHRLKAALLREPGVQVLDIPVVARDGEARARDALEVTHPARHVVCVLVSSVNNATRQAIEYAETLQAADIRAVSFALDPEESEGLARQWLESRIPVPLEIEDSPFRDIGRSLRIYLDQFDPDGIERLVTVVIPEFVVARRHHQFLHGQTPLILKRHLLFEPGVVVVSVPYHIGSETTAQPREAPATAG
jgi:hypothetical protein